VDEKTTIFFHSETLQICPLEDTTLISFLKSYKNHGYEITQSKFKKENFKEIYDFICEQIGSALVSPTFAVQTDTSYRPEECQLEGLLWELFVQLYYHVLRISPKYFELKEKEDKERQSLLENNK
jgi:hypothetical protein